MTEQATTTTPAPAATPVATTPAATTPAQSAPRKRLEMRDIDDFEGRPVSNEDYAAALESVGHKQAAKDAVKPNRKSLLDPEGLAEAQAELEAQHNAPIDADVDTEDAQDTQEGTLTPEQVAALGRGELPSEVLEMLTMEVTEGGDTRRITLKEMQNGYMRQSNHTRGMQSLADDRKAFTTEKDAAMANLDKAFTDPDEMLSLIRSLGKDAILRPLLDRVANEVMIEESMTPEQLTAYRTQQADARKLRDLKHERDRLKAELDASRFESKGKAIQESFMTHAINALTTAGIPINNALQKRFIAELKRVSKAEVPTQEHFTQAATELRSMLDEEGFVRAKKVQQSQRPRGFNGQFVNTSEPAALSPEQKAVRGKDGKGKKMTLEEMFERDGDWQ
jgi:hypothetical protein